MGDCSCIGRKTVTLMSAEDQKKPLNRDSPQLNELMLTSGQLCLKDRLVARCVSSRQGSELQCLCITDGVLNAFTPGELSETLEHVSAGASPPKYQAIRADCMKR